MARMPALTTSGSRSQAATTTARSGGSALESALLLTVTVGFPREICGSFASCPSHFTPAGLFPPRRAVFLRWSPASCRAVLPCAASMASGGLFVPPVSPGRGTWPANRFRGGYRHYLTVGLANAVSVSRARPRSGDHQSPRRLLLGGRARRHADQETTNTRRVLEGKASRNVLNGRLARRLPRRGRSGRPFPPSRSRGGRGSRRSRRRQGRSPR